MGSRSVSSLRSKKKSVEDLRKRKNIKSRKRRRVSLSQSSCSSDSDDVSHRRRSSRRKYEKRHGRDSKRSVKKKRRKARHRSVSSNSRDSSSWSSRGRDDGKGKLKEKVKRSMKLDKAHRALISRNSSLSCSTCSSNGRPSSPDLFREAKRKERDDLRHIESPSVIECRAEQEEMCVNKGMEKKMKTIMADAVHKLGLGEENMVMNEGFYEKGVEIDRWMSEGNAEKYVYFYQIEDDRIQPSELSTNLSSRIKSEIVACDKHDSESDDLEMKLRKKALENLMKLRGGLSSVNGDANNRKNELAEDESSEKACKTAKKLISSSKSNCIVSKERHILPGVQPHGLTVNPSMKIPSLNTDFPTNDETQVLICMKESINSEPLESKTSDPSTSNRLLNDVEYLYEKNSHRHSQCKGSQEKNIENGNSLRIEANFGDKLPCGNPCSMGKEKDDDAIEIVKECRSGSQFEEKTFSRVHDGEMVQVGNVLYIYLRLTTSSLTQNSFRA